MSIEDKVLLFFNKKVSKKIDKNLYLTDFCTNEDDAYYLFLDFFSEFEIEEGYLDLDMYFYKSNSFLYNIVKYLNKQ